jgi:hypothetical protein
MTKRLLIGLAVLASFLPAQRRVDPRNTYYRLICVVPVVGQGTGDDPRRPAYAPTPSEMKKVQESLDASPEAAGSEGKPVPVSTAIIAFAQQISDDGQYALVEFVAHDRAAFQAILDDKSVKVAFEKGKHKREDIERELKKYKKEFNLDQFGVVMP